MPQNTPIDRPKNDILYISQINAWFIHNHSGYDIYFHYSNHYLELIIWHADWYADWHADWHDDWHDSWQSWWQIFDYWHDDLSLWLINWLMW